MDTVFYEENAPTENSQDLQAFLSGLGAHRHDAGELCLRQHRCRGDQLHGHDGATQDIDGTDKNHFLHRDTEGSREWRLYRGTSI
jgi:hypothetical protein